MKFIRRWYNFILILILFSLGLVMLNVMNFFGSEPEMVVAPIPDDAETIVRIDAKTLWRKGAYSVIFQTENYSMIDVELKKIINNKFIKRSGNILPIDFNKDVVFFNLQYNEHNYQVAVFQLMDATKFLKMTAEERTKNRLAFNIGNNGYLVYGPDNSDATSLNAIKKQITSSKAIPFAELGERSDFITVKSGIKDLKLDYQIGIQQTTDAFTIKGDISGKIDFEPMKYAVRSKGLTVTLAFSPISTTGKMAVQYPEMKNELGMVTQISDPLPYFTHRQLTGISVDYYGVQVENGIEGLPSIQGMLPLAKMNAVFRFNKTVSLDSVMSCFPKENRLDNNTINLYGIKYHVRLIDEYNLFVGVDENAVIPGSRADLFRMKGNLENLTKINSTSFFVKAVLNNFTPIKTLASFSKATDKVDFAIYNSGKDKFQVTGILPFKEGKNSINEIFKFLLTAMNMSSSGRMVP